VAGAIYCPVQPGDVSPGSMNVDKEEAKEAANGSAEKRKAMLEQLKKTKELRKNMKR
jgi:hypothetical protein